MMEWSVSDKRWISKVTAYPNEKIAYWMAIPKSPRLGPQHRPKKF